MESWALTIRKQMRVSDTVTEADYEPIISLMGTKLIRHVFEKDKAKDHKHLHGIIELPRNYFRSKLMLKGFHTHFVRIYNIDGWVKYMEKDQEFRQKVSFDLWVQDVTSDATQNKAEKCFSGQIE